MEKFLPHMPVVAAYGRRLTALQTVWDSLALLSQMSGDGTDMGRTRQAFASLSAELVNQLAAETHRKTLLELGAKAQVTIDVLVRNLYERTADIGFLCLDDAIADFLDQGAGDPAAHAALHRRLREYADKYTVYQDIVLLDAQGRVVARLAGADEGANDHLADPLVAEALSTSHPFVERYGPSALFPGEGDVLLYAWRLSREGRRLGVLCLRFDFAAEMRGIFGKLAGADDWTVLTLVAPDGRVIASSDPWQVPVGAPLPVSAGAGGGVGRFAGREYLCATRRSQSYQGYEGPGWMGLALLPIEHAFEEHASERLEGVDRTVLAEVERAADVFSPELRSIPLRAQDIQRELTQAVWNGNVKLTAQQGQDNAFSRSLLREISATGLRTKEVFEKSITDLHETVVASLLHDCRFRASLAVGILDRNLYERANDCRWWALNGTLAAALQKGDTASATAVLERINALYTVYDNLVLFDRDGFVLAVSNPARRSMVGAKLAHGWARDILMLSGTQAFAVSPFEALSFYDDAPSWVFGAAVRSGDGRTLGGIAIVFDAATQLAGMLEEVLPRDREAGGCAMFVEPGGRVIAASSGCKAGDRIELPPALLDPPADGAVAFMVRDGRHHAVASRRSSGYREFQGLGVIAVVTASVAPAEAAQEAQLPPFVFARRSVPRAEAIDVATVACGRQWLALPASRIVAAIQDARPTRLPGRAPWMAGVIRHGDALVPVVDLGTLLGQPHAARTAGSAQTIVVAREGGQIVGLAVDGLGDVFDVAPSEIAPVEGTGGERDPLTRGILRAREPGDSTALVLDLEAVLRAVA